MTTTTTTLDHRFNRDPEIHDGMVGVCELCGQQQWQDAERVCPVAVADSTLEARIQYLKKLTAYELANIADIANPNSLSSPGAEMLERVKYNVLEWLEYDAEKPLPIGQLADSAMTVYTHDIWLEFVDLCAYREDVEDHGGDMNERATYALYSIAHRLLHTLCDMLNFTTDMD
jgi:hypothetical protein